ncbi:MAG: hypothetical protein IIY74_03210 [Firmicutes bacterium]|nr:hypothetical protein [Bacillota bacterium]
MGALFTLVNFNLTFGETSVNVMPNFAGWILVYLACGLLGDYIADKAYLKPASVATVVVLFKLRKEVRAL